MDMSAVSATTAVPDRLSQLGICCAPVTGALLDPTAAETLAHVFKALGDPTRVRLLSPHRRHRRRGGVCLRYSPPRSGCPSPPSPTT